TAVNGVAVPLAAVPFGRIVNNTIYGGNTAAGTGILVTNNAGPTLLNNIVANTATGISVDSTSTATTVVGYTLYSGNLSNVPNGASTGSNPIVLNPGDPLFIDAPNQNFYPAPGSQAVDSALDTLADRFPLAAVKSSIGIPQSPIITPDHDIYGQLRVDDPSQNTPTGLGQNVFKDRGAVERADFTQPTADVFVTDSNNANISDNDTATPFRDRDRTVGNLAIRNTNLIQFVIQLGDNGVGIDDATVDNTKFVLTEDGVVLNDQFAAAALGVSADYQFEYNETTDTVILAPSAGFWPLNHTYKVLINNTDGTTVDSLGNPIPAGIFDLAGNTLAANHATGELSFSIFVGTLYDFGDAPDPYPTKLANNGAAATVQDGYFLGTGISEESEALQNADASADGDSPPNPNFFDGIKFIGNPAPSKNGTIVNTLNVTASIPAGMTGKLDAWFDLNRDFDWDDAGEKITLINTTPGHPGAQPGDIFDGFNTFTFSFGDANTTKGSTFARFQLSPTGVSSPTFVTVNGVAPDGEVEDEKISISSAPFQNPNPDTTNFQNALDVNNDGVISAADVLTIINVINAHPGMSALALGQPPVPNPVGNAPGQYLYVDVDGDNKVTASDIIKVIDWINNPAHRTTGGEATPEGEAPIEMNTAQANAADSSNLSIPPVLLAAPNVVIDVQDKAPVATVLANQSVPASTTQDQALLALGDGSADTDLSLLGPKTPSADLVDEASWEDLITYLASDQQPKT
ncbi:MAG TPA: dockerin type I domain-containing protein, partial [Pirellulaceae bacterium]